MFRSQTVMLALFALVLGLGLAPLVNNLASSERESEFAARAMNIATVDMEEVIEDFIQKSGAFDNLRQTYNSKRRALAQIGQQIQSMEQEAGVYPRNSQEYFDISAKIAVKQAEYKYNSEVNKAQYDNQQATLTKETYEKARQVVENIAKQEGYDFVLMKQNGRVIGNLMSEVSSSIVVRTVLYAKDSRDITARVKQQMK